MDLLGTPARSSSTARSTSTAAPSSAVTAPPSAAGARATSRPAAPVAPAARRGVRARWVHRARVVLLDATVRLPRERAAAEVAAADHDDLATALDDLAHRVADVEHAWAARAVLAELVLRLEHLAGVPRTAPAPDPVVVLQRRFDHTHRLLREDPRGLTAADVRALHRGFDGPA